MTDIHVIVGPAICRGCDRRVVYGTARVKGRNGQVPRWRDPETGRMHRCPPEAPL